MTLTIYYQRERRRRGKERREEEQAIKKLVSTNDLGVSTNGLEGYQQKIKENNTVSNNTTNKKKVSKSTKRQSYLDRGYTETVQGVIQKLYTVINIKI